MAKLNDDLLNQSIADVLAFSQGKTVTHNKTEKQGKKRKFMETIDLQFALKNYDPQKDKRFSGTFKLPTIPRPNMKICVIANAVHAEKAESAGFDYKTEEDLKKFNKNKKIVKKFAAQYGRKDVAYAHTAATLKELRETIVDSSAANTLEDVARTKSQMDEQKLTMSKRKEQVEAQNAYILPIYSTAKRAIYDTSKQQAMLGDDMGDGSAYAQAVGDSKDRSMELTRTDIRGARDSSLRNLLRVEDGKKE